MEINPGLTKLIKPHIEISADERIAILRGDARRTIRRNRENWDVVIMAVPDPSSMQINRYYTDGFIKLLKQRLNTGGVVIYGISPSGNYISPEKINLEASLFHTLSGAFSHVRIVAGERDYFIASDDTLSVRMGELSTARGIQGSYVNAGYMDDFSVEAREKSIMENIGGITIKNTDMKPLPVFYHTLRYLSQFMGRNFSLLLIPALLVMIFLLRMNRVTAGMFVTGLTASSAEILLIFWFQVVFGNLYAAIGLIFALFMGGLALGSSAGNRVNTSRRHFLSGQLMLALFMVLLPLLWKSEQFIHSPFLLWVLFIPALLAPSFLTGFQYVATTRMYPAGEQRAAVSVYAADLWGSALGALVITTLLVPVAGVYGSCFIMAGLNLLVAGINLVRK